MASSGLASPLPMVLLVPGLLALRVRLVRVPLARHRRLFLHHHAGDDLRGDAGLLPQRYGLRRQQRLHRLQGHRSASASKRSTRRVLYHALGGRAHGQAVCCRGARDLELRPGADRDPRRRGARGSSAIGSSMLQALVIRAIGGAWPASPARSTCRRWASSIRASSRRPIPSRSRSGWRSAGAAPLVGAVLGAVAGQRAKTWLHQRVARSGCSCWADSSSS